MMGASLARRRPGGASAEVEALKHELDALKRSLRPRRKSREIVALQQFSLTARSR